MGDPILQLQVELVAAADREVRRRRAEAKPRVRVRRRALRGALVFAASLVAVSGTAVGASELWGPPVRGGYEIAGGVRLASVGLLPLRVADPASGLPWGIRTYAPRGADGSSAARCTQVGHVLGNELGVLGEDGAFGNDGLFHIVPVDALTQCARAATFNSLPVLVPASGFEGPGSCVPPALRGRVAVPPSDPGGPACSAEQMRLIVFGVAPAGTTTVRLRASSGVVSEHIAANARGAFLFVLPAPPAMPATVPAPPSFS